MAKTPKTGRLCDAGLHPMDPNWKTCPYCENERRAKERTQHSVIESSRESRTGARKTSVGGEGAAGEMRVTKVLPTQDSPQPEGGGSEMDRRRIMGILITYSWNPAGQMFPVREGKNFIGAGDVASEAIHRECDIRITEDARMSGEHAVILCRHGRYEIVDRTSANGTFLNGEMVPIQGAELSNYATIQTGATSWTFILVEVPAAPRTAPPSTEFESEKPKGETARKRNTAEGTQDRRHPAEAH
jgi:pSer/pThr/pTyr-binding forkhead associated (FHA) protein